MDYIFSILSSPPSRGSKIANQYIPLTTEVTGFMLSLFESNLTKKSSRIKTSNFSGERYSKYSYDYFLNFGEIAL